jgi:hypothetical protein
MKCLQCIVLFWGCNIIIFYLSNYVKFSWSIQLTKSHLKTHCLEIIGKKYTVQFWFVNVIWGHSFKDFKAYIYSKGDKISKKIKLFKIIANAFYNAIWVWRWNAMLQFQILSTLHLQYRWQNFTWKHIV